MGHSVHCVAKTSTLYYNTMYSLNSLSEISTDLNDDWCAESRRNFSSLISILSTTPEQCCLCTLRTADLTYLTEVDPWRSQECELGGSPPLPPSSPLFPFPFPFPSPFNGRPGV